jgi:hypothetical protein
MSKSLNDNKNRMKKKNNIIIVKNHLMTKDKEEDTQFHLKDV